LTCIASYCELLAQFVLAPDNVRGQVNYQKANADLYQYEISNGTDSDLKAFAQETLPKIQDHLARALKLQARD
jgi:putative membrane protein